MPSYPVNAGESTLDITSTAVNIPGKDLNVDSGVLFVDSINNRVGINTATPSYELDVDGTIHIKLGGELIFPDGSSMNTANVGSAASVSNNADADITADADANGSGEIELNIASKTFQRILNDGSIYFQDPTIGSSVNSPKLHLIGNHFSGGLDHAVSATLQLVQNSDPYLSIAVSDDGLTPLTTEIIRFYDTKLLFATDNAVDIGAVGANRPKNYYGSGTITAAGVVTSGGFTTVAGNVSAVNVYASSKIGVGTGAPAENLSVYGTGATVELSVDGPTTAEKLVVWKEAGTKHWNAGTYPGEKSKFWYLYSYTNDQDRLTIDANGRMGFNKKSNILNYHSHFSGSGLNDMEVSGIYTGARNVYIKVVIDTLGATDTFKWALSYDSVTYGAYTTGINCSLVPIDIHQGISISFTAVTGHTLSDEWSFLAQSQIPAGTLMIYPSGYDEILSTPDYTAVAPIFLDMSYDAQTTEVAPFPIFTVGSADGALYIGNKTKWSALQWNIVSSGTGVTLVIEYWDGANWQTLGAGEDYIDATNSLANSGLTSWDTALFTWAVGPTVDDYDTLYFLRITSSTIVTVQPSIYVITRNGAYRTAVFAAYYDALPSFYVDPIGRVSVGGGAISGDNFLQVSSKDTDSIYTTKSLNSLVEFDVHVNDPTIFTLRVSDDLDSNKMSIAFIKSGGTLSVPTAISATEVLGAIEFYGYVGSAGWKQGVEILASVDGTPSNGNDIPSKIEIKTSADASATPTTRMTIRADGTVEPGSNGTQALGTSSLRWGTIYGSTSGLYLYGAARYTQITSNEPAVNRVYTIIDAGGNAEFVLTGGTQTIGGAKTFSSAVTITPTTNQLVLGSVRTLTINAPTPAGASRIYTIPDVGASANFIVSSSVPAEGELLYYDGSVWKTLITGVPGQFLQTEGAGMAPQWADGLLLDQTIPQTVINGAPIFSGGLKTTAGALSPGAVEAQFGDTIPFYITANWPTLAFNAYFDAGWKYGAGSNGDFGGFQSLNPNTGEMNYYLSSVGGNDGNAANMQLVFAFYPDGTVKMPFYTDDGFIKSSNNDGTLVVDTTSYEVALTFSTGLTRAVNTVTVDLSTGKAGSQSVIGGTAASETLTLSSTANGVKGKILFGTSAYDEANNRLGIATANPNYTLEIIGDTKTTTLKLLETGGGADLVTITAASLGASRAYTIPDAGGSADFVMTAGTQTVGGAKTFSSAVTITPTTNQLVLGTTRTLTINAPTPAGASRIYTIPDAAAAADFIVSTSTPVQGDVLYYNGTTWVSLVAGNDGEFLKTQGAGANPTWATAPVGTGTAGNLALYPASTAVIDDAYVVNGNNIFVSIAAHGALGTTRTYTIPNSGADADFVMTAGNQTIGGAKTFSSAIAVTATSNHFVLSTATQTATITAATQAGARVYTIPDAGGSANFIMSAGTQTVGGAKTFSSAVTITPTTNQLVLGATRTVTITAPTPAGSSRTHTIPDAGGDMDFMLISATGLANGDLAYHNGTTWTRIAVGNPSQVLAVSGGIPSWQDLGNVSAGIAGNLALYPASAAQVDDAYVVNGNNIFVSIANHGALGATRTYTIPNSGADASFVMTAGNQTIGGAKTFSSAIAVTATSNHFVLSTATQTATITAATQASAQVYTIPDAGGSADFVMTASTQTVGGAKTFSSAVTITPTTNQLVLGATRTVTITAPTPAGSSRTHTIPDAGANMNFMLISATGLANGDLAYHNGTTWTRIAVGNPNQVLAVSGGIPAWVDGTSVSSGIAGNLALYPASAAQVDDAYVVNGNNIFVSIAAHGALGATRTYTIPNSGADASFVMTAGTQTIGGAKTFSTQIAVTATSNHFVLSTATQTATITAATQAGARVYSIPDAGGNANFLLSTIAGNQTIDLVNVAADTTLTITNSNATYKANLAVEGTITTRWPFASIAVAQTPYSAGTEQVIIANAVGGAITINLPAVATSAGKRYHIKKTDVSAYNIIVDGNGAETIDGELTQLLNAQYDALHIFCDGVTWHVL